MAGHDKLTPEGQKFYATIEELSRLQVRVGFQAGEKADASGADLCDIAAWNEVGTDTIPSRPFFAQSVDGHKSEIDSMCKSALKGIANGESAKAILSKVGQRAVDLVVDEIGGGSFAENKPATIKRKGSEHPLIDTGLMQQSVHYFIKGKE
jgi:hypothetical protein